MLDPIVLVLGAAAVVVVLILPSIRIIGPTQVGLAIKRFSLRTLSEDNPIAFRGEAGYQAKLLMPGWRIKLWILYRVDKHPWVQIPAGKIGVAVAQIGQALPTGAKSAVYKKEFGNFTDLNAFLQNGGQKGVQRPVLPPGTLAPIHPAAFLIITENKVLGVPVSEELRSRARALGGNLTPECFDLASEQLRVIRISPQTRDEHGMAADMIGIVIAYEGQPLPPGAIASRLDGFSDIESMERSPETTDHDLIEAILGSKNEVHNNYQNFQAFLDNGGRIGLQHDPLLYGAYTLNPFLVNVELVPMLVVEQGQVAVIKSYVGLVTQDTSGEEFKFGSLVRPGHRGIWQEPLRTGKYPINPHCYRPEIVPTIILTLNWAKAVSHAHELDAQLKPILAKSREGFEFFIDLQVQIHVADTQAPWVISMVGTMQNLVNEVLQAAVGNHFRDKMQGMPAVRFIETRHSVQQEALSHIQEELGQYKVETPGVYIQDVVLPGDMVRVLTEREIANQEIETYKMQEQAQRQRIDMEQAKGTADMQHDLSKSQVNIEIKGNEAKARKAEAAGEAEYIEKTGAAQGARFRSIGMARAEAFRAQAAALGQTPTALVNVANALAEGGNRFVPEVLVTGGNNSGPLDSLAAVLTRHFLNSRSAGPPPPAEPPGERAAEGPQELAEPAEKEGPPERPKEESAKPADAKPAPQPKTAPQEPPVDEAEPVIPLLVEAPPQKAAPPEGEDVDVT